MKTVEVFTDGGAGQPGAWRMGSGASVWRPRTGASRLGGEYDQQPNGVARRDQRPEAMTEPCAVVLTTDSTYVKDGITRWIRNWKANGWKTAAKKPVKNKDLWERLDTECLRHQVDWRWVKDMRAP